MKYKFGKGNKVIVCGPGKNFDKYYKNLPAKIVERDPYFHDYHVEFKNGEEDWLSPEYLRKPYSRKKKRRK